MAHVHVDAERALDVEVGALLRSDARHRLEQRDGGAPCKNPKGWNRSGVMGIVASTRSFATDTVVMRSVSTRAMGISFSAPARRRASRFSRTSIPERVRVGTGQSAASVPSWRSLSGGYGKAAALWAVVDEARAGVGGIDGGASARASVEKLLSGWFPAKEPCSQSLMLQAK